MNNDGPQSGNFRRLQRSQQRIAEELLSQSRALKFPRDCQSRQDHHRHVMPCQTFAGAFRHFLILHRAIGKGVVAREFSVLSE